MTKRHMYYSPTSSRYMYQIEENRITSNAMASIISAILYVTIQQHYWSMGKYYFGWPIFWSIVAEIGLAKLFNYYLSHELEEKIIERMNRHENKKAKRRSKRKK